MIFLMLLNPMVAALTSRFLILRHGQTNHNAAGILQGSSDISRLTDKGKQQARDAGAALASLSGLRILRVYVSPLARAQETWKLLAHDNALDLEVDVLPQLREIDLYSWEGRQKEDISASSPDAYMAWKVDPLGLEIDGHRPVVELWERARGAWAELLDGGASNGLLEGTTLVVCHNQVGKALLCTALGLDETHLRAFEFPNCGALELEWPADATCATRWRWRLPLPGDAEQWRVGV